jgi:hypothetical protein
VKNLLNNSWWLVAILLLCGCGGGGGVTSGSLSGAPSDPPQNPPAPGLIAAENWQFSTTSTQGFPSITIAGGIDQSNTPVSGVVHMDGPPCFDHLTAVALSGVLNDSNLSLTSSPTAGQVITAIGSITKDPLSDNSKLTGTYSIHGGCADGDQGNITGRVETTLRGPWAGDMTSTLGNINRLTVTLSQGSATADGTFGITGAAGFEVGTCFQRAEIVSGKFPSGSYMMGQTVALQIKTDNGMISFLGTADHGGLIEGNYTMAGGTCDPKGTGYLSPWEY